jgi:NADPH-dependent ferric siderophore reductase
VRIRLDDETLFERGDPTGGTTVRRVVLVAERTTRTRTVSASEGTRYTLPRRTDQVELTFGIAADVETVRVNGRVVLHDPDGLTGPFTVQVSRYETATLTFEGGSGEVEVAGHPLQTKKATLRVTVDA